MMDAKTTIIAMLVLSLMFSIGYLSAQQSGGVTMADVNETIASLGRDLSNERLQLVVLQRMLKEAQAEMVACKAKLPVEKKAETSKKKVDNSQQVP